MEVSKAAGASRADGSAAATPSSALLDDPASPQSYAPLYLTSGLGSITFDIEHLQDLAFSRQRLLKSAGEQGAASALSAPDLRKAERDHGFHIPPSSNPDHVDLVLKDEASHFLLRLALSRSHEHRQWFLARETALFSARLGAAGMAAVLAKIAAVDGPEISPVPADDLPALAEDLDAVARGVRHEDTPTTYFRVAFEHVPGLIRHRRVLVRAGIAYVPAANVRDVVVAQFRARLSHALVTASKAVGVAEQDARMRAILDAVRERHAAGEASRTDFEERGVGSISLNTLQESLPAMPLCQMNLMQRLGEDHHLRHAGRMQLGVFLKGCGLTVDESLVFWKREFGKGGIDGDKFNKNYAYNIRHHYGKEGKRKNLQPFPCIRVINDRPGPGEHHGCPYREFTPQRLKSTLTQVGVPEVAHNPILNNAKDGNFQAACGLCFAATQPGEHEMAEGGVPMYFPAHPNDYFIRARTRRVVLEDVGISAEGEDDEEMAPENSPPMETPIKADKGEQDGEEGETPVTKMGRADCVEDVAPAAKRVRIDAAEGEASAVDEGGTSGDGTAKSGTSDPSVGEKGDVEMESAGEDQTGQAVSGFGVEDAVVSDAVADPVTEVSGAGSSEMEVGGGESSRLGDQDIVVPGVELENKAASVQEAHGASASKDMGEDGNSADDPEVAIPDAEEKAEGKEEMDGSAEVEPDHEDEKESAREDEDGENPPGSK